MRNLLANSTVKTLLPAVQSLAATLTGSGVDLRGMGRKVLVILDTGIDGGTAPLLDVTIEERDGTGPWTALHTFAQLDGATMPSTVIVDLTPKKEQIRAVAAISGGAGAQVSLAVEAIIYLERQKPSGI